MLNHARKNMKASDIKEKFIVLAVITGIFLPVRLLFYTYISSHWLGSFGLVSAVSVLMYVLVKKKKLGWFGVLFEKQMGRITKGKAGKIVFSSAMIMLVYLGALAKAKAKCSLYS